MEYADGFATIVNSFRDFELSESQKEFTLRWQSIKEDFTKCLNTYQNPTLTEFAALGLACILLTNHTNLSITEVCYRGESVDYWLGNENDRKKYVLEVSGRSTGSIDDLCIEKTAQLKANPWKRGGFVCVIILSHQ
ncbi:hypothetical protein QQ056_01110 [Oscillatoria laete-virens NRMC-F 0139]|nr:hypothetical protein [Oscillatoria laete-virens NRMC-F 0139]